MYLRLKVKPLPVSPTPDAPQSPLKDCEPQKSDNGISSSASPTLDAPPPPPVPQIKSELDQHSPRVPSSHYWDPIERKGKQTVLF